MSNDAFLGTTAMPPAPQAVEEDVERFDYDYKYVSREEVKNITVSQLAKLEADLHNLRMMFVANGRNPDLQINEARTVVEEMKTIAKVIEELEGYFAEVLTA